MNRRVGLVSSFAVTAVAAALLTPVSVSAAPEPKPLGGSSKHLEPVPQTDRDRDHVSDDYASRLRSADTGARQEVIVTGLGTDAARGAVGRFHVTRRLPIIDGFAAVMTAGQARALARHPGVRRVERDGVVRALDDGTNADFGATGARVDRAGLDGSGIGLCVVDTGADPAHEQLAGRPVTFKDFIGTQTTAYDDHGHGTHVMAIAAGDGTGGSTAATFGGVAPAASLFAAKVLDATGYGSDSQVVAGIQWCHAQSGVHVISMSLGDTVPSDGSDAVSLAVNTAVAGGDVVVVAAGNSGDQPGTINSPGVATGAITVGAASDWSAPVGTDRHDDGIWLAAFSSRGPTVDGRVKPDITAPGVSVRSADAGTAAGYVTMSGTSMATPYVAGAVALALEAAPTATPDAIRAALTATAADRGSPATDNEWGAGLVDVRALVDAVAGASPLRRTSFPTWQHHTGSVPDNGFVDVPVVIGPDGLVVPLAVTLTTTSGSALCHFFCLIVEWTPDLDMELRSPSGAVLARSECALSGLSCGIGRQETIGIRPGVSGTYVLRVYAFTGDPNYGKGGSFALDVSKGPLGGSVTPPPPPVPNVAPDANAGPDATYTLPSRKGAKATFLLNGSGSSDSDGVVTSFTWRLGTKVVGTSANLSQSKAAGVYRYTLTVRDDDGATDSDEVVVTVVR